MIAVLVLLLFRCSKEDRPLQKLRVWFVMFLSWLAGVMAVTVTQSPDPVLAFLTIDIAAAFLVLRHPRSLAQNVIGCLYVAMIALHIGYVWAASDALGSVGHANLEKYLLLQVWIGWLQLAALTLWSVGDVGKAIGVRLGIVGHVSPHSADLGADAR